MQLGTIKPGIGILLAINPEDHNQIRGAISRSILTGEG